MYTGVADIIRSCNNIVSDAQILRKSFGGVKFTSNIQHTKSKSKRQRNEGGGVAGVADDSHYRVASVYPGRGNLSPIGICQGSVQRHPGKATASTPRLFCKWCGIHVGSEKLFFLEVPNITHNVRFETT